MVRRKGASHARSVVEVDASLGSTIFAGCRWCLLTTGSGSDQVVLVGEGTGGGPRLDTHLGEDVLKVPGHGVLAQDERRCDLPVALPGGDETQHLALSGAETVLPGSRPRGKGGGHFGEVGPRAQTGEDLRRG